jgi:hypothetical protein
MSTATHFLGFWLSYANASELRFEVFAAGLLLPPIMLALFARRHSTKVLVFATFGLGIGMFSVLVGGILFWYLGPTGIDYYEKLGWLLYIFVAPFSILGAVVSLLTWPFVRADLQLLK